MKKRFNPAWRIVVALILVFALTPVLALSGTVIAETTAPTLLSITWDDSGGTTAGVIDVGDDLIFHFSESMLTFTLDSMGEINARLDSTATGTADYGITGATLLWAGSGTWLTVTLGTEENIAGGETVNPTSTVKDKAGNADGTTGNGPAIPLPPDTTSPTLLSITWIDNNTNGIIDVGDDLLFHFSESMDTTTVDDATELNARLDSSASGTTDYGTTPGITWNTPGTQCTVTLDTGEAIEGGETVNPASTVTDKAGNSDGTTGNGPAIPLPPDPTKPTLLSIGWTDIDTSTTITAGDRLVFKFSESMKTSTVTNTTINADLLLSGTGTTYGTTPGITWDIAETLLTVTLGTGTDIVGGETVNPASTVTDKAGNADNTSATGPAIPTTPTAVSAETTCPTLLSITWNDSGGATAGVIDAGDDLIFHFSEAMKTTTVDAINVNTRLDSSASGTADYGSTGLAVAWNTPGTQCTVTLGTEEYISGGETVNPISAVEDMAGNDDTTSSPIPAIPLPPDPTAPTLVSIVWDDVDSSGIIDGGDKLVFHFSEAMDSTTVDDAAELNARLDSTASGAADYGTAPTMTWDTPTYTQLTVFLDSDENIGGGETVNPTSDVTDMAGNADGTTGAGTQIPTTPGVADTTNPVTASVTTPTAGESYNAASMSTTFSGRAADNSGGVGLNADSTTFTLRNPALDYWTGSAWGALTYLATTHDATTSNTQVTWTDAVTLPAWTDGSTYTVQAKAIDKNSNDRTGTAVTFTYDTTAPTAIITLAAAAVAGTSNIALTWTAPTDNVGLDHYVVKRATSAITTTSAWNAATTLTSTLSGTATSYTDTTGTSGTTYYYNVRAVDAADNMAALSNSPSATAGADTTAPTAIITLAAAAVAGTSNIALTWTAPTDNVGLDHYVVKRAAASITTTSAWNAATTLTYTLSGTATSYTDTTGTSGTTYYYNVRAVDAADNMAALSNSPSATAGADTTAPTAIITLAAAAVAGTSNIALTWTAPTDNVGLDHYVVKRATSAITTSSAWSAATELTLTLSGTATSYTDETGTSGSTYYYNVRAVDAADNMAALSNSPSATAGADITGPTMTGIDWTDVDDSNTINEDDTLCFKFSEAMDTATITATNIETMLPTDPSHSYGTLTADDLSWSYSDKWFWVTLGSGETIVGGETVDPSDSVTDVAGNPDNTTAPPAIEVPEEEEGFAWEWWYTLLIALGALIIIAAIVLLLVLPKRGAAEEFAEEELYEEEEEF